jgi:hypothetical protein
MSAVAIAKVRLFASELFSLPFFISKRTFSRATALVHLPCGISFQIADEEEKAKLAFASG